MVPIDFLILKMVLKALTQHLDYILTGEDDIAAFVDGACIGDRKSTRLNSSHLNESRMPSSA